MENRKLEIPVLQKTKSAAKKNRSLRWLRHVAHPKAMPHQFVARPVKLLKRMPARVVRSLKMALHAATNKASAIVQQTQVIPASEQLITLLLHVSILLASFGTGCRGFGTAGRSFFYSDFVYLLWFDECFFCLLLPFIFHQCEVSQKLLILK